MPENARVPVSPEDVIAENAQIRAGCLCPEAMDGPRQVSCRCDERADRLAHEWAGGVLVALAHAGFVVVPSEPTREDIARAAASVYSVNESRACCVLLAFLAPYRSTED